MIFYIPFVLASLARSTSPDHSNPRVVTQDVLTNLKRKATPGDAQRIWLVKQAENAMLIIEKHSELASEDKVRSLDAFGRFVSVVLGDQTNASVQNVANVLEDAREAYGWESHRANLYERFIFALALQLPLDILGDFEGLIPGKDRQAILARLAVVLRKHGVSASPIDEYTIGNCLTESDHVRFVLEKETSELASYVAALERAWEGMDALTVASGMDVSTTYMPNALLNMYCFPEPVPAKRLTLMQKFSDMVDSEAKNLVTVEWARTLEILAVTPLSSQRIHPDFSNLSRYLPHFLVRSIEDQCDFHVDAAALTMQYLKQYLRSIQHLLSSARHELPPPFILFEPNESIERIVQSCADPSVHDEPENHIDRINGQLVNLAEWLPAGDRLEEFEEAMLGQFFAPSDSDPSLIRIWWRWTKFPTKSQADPNVERFQGGLFLFMRMHANAPAPLFNRLESSISKLETVEQTWQLACQITRDFGIDFFRYIRVSENDRFRLPAARRVCEALTKLHASSEGRPVDDAWWFTILNGHPETVERFVAYIERYVEYYQAFQRRPYGMVGSLFGFVPSAVLGE